MCCFCTGALKFGPPPTGAQVTSVSQQAREEESACCPESPHEAKTGAKSLDELGMTISSDERVEGDPEDFESDAKDVEQEQGQEQEQETGGGTTTLEPTKPSKAPTRTSLSTKRGKWAFKRRKQRKPVSKGMPVGGPLPLAAVSGTEEFSPTQEKRTPEPSPFVYRPDPKWQAWLSECDDHWKREFDKLMNSI